MADLSYTPIFHAKLQTCIEEEVAILTQALAQGSASDYADYQGRCGVIRGLFLALDLAEKTRKHVLEN